MTTRWLLLLGSNLPDESRVRAALLGLVKLGAPRVCTPIRRFPAYAGHGKYFNVLAELSGDLRREALDAALKRLEADLGRLRDSGVGTEVAIDIDILARHDGARWLADAHAVAKGEFSHQVVQTLLQQADIEIRQGDSSETQADLGGPL